MREVSQYLSHRGNPVRRILTHAIVAFVAVILLVLMSTMTAFAANPATWSGNGISYAGDSYSEQKANGTTPPGLNNNQLYYLHAEITDTAAGTGEATIIYFPSGTNLATATSAKSTVYAIDNSGKYGSKVSGPTDIALVAKSTAPKASEAGWAGTNIEYDSRTYAGKGGAAYVADGTTAPVFSKGTLYYQAVSTPDVNGNSTLYVISFPSGTVPTDATSASYSTYKIDNSGKIGAQTGTTKTITIVPSTVSNSAPNGTTDASGANSATTCAVEGIGWIVCPVSNFLAWGMDNIFTALKGFLEVEPLSTDNTSALYQAWNAVRSIANVAFVIAFLVIIFSQVTNLGVSNYGLKKLIPRLVVAAVLVNVSYIICAVAVDLSNVIGGSLQDFLISLRTSLTGPNTKSISSWESVTGYILAAGTATGAAAVTISGIVISSGASLGAALILLLPALLGLILAVLVALLVLAARQALIIVLIIVAPLAFVAYLLPNTEKLFERWRGLFITMLVFFPLFALIFGGSQLAGFLIIQTASDINVILLAMFVQVAPLVLTPLLVKFSGGIIGRIAGFVNDPKKGLIDRTRNWSKQKSELWAAQNMARRDPIRSRQVFRRYAQGADQLKRSQEARLAAYKEASDARWTRSQPYNNIQQDLLFAQDEKTEGTENATLRYETSKTLPGRSQDLNLRLRQVKQTTENVKALSDIQWDNNHSAPVAEQRVLARARKEQLATIHSTHDAEFEEFKNGRVGNFPATAAVGAMMHQVHEDQRLLALNAMRNESAKRAFNEEFTRELQNNVRFQGQLMQSYAGGIQGATGAQRALAAAISAADKASDEAINNAMTILSNGNLDDSIITNIALGNAAGTGITLTDDMIKAATKRIASGANMVELMRLAEGIEINSSDANQDIRQLFSETMLANPNKPKFIGAGTMARTKQGNAPAAGPGRSYSWITDAINSDKYGSAEVLVTQDNDALIKVLDAINDGTSRANMYPQALAKIKSEILLAQTDHRYSGRIAERQATLQAIYDAI